MTGRRRSMGRRDFIAVALAALVAATPAVAQDVVASVIRQLRRQGFQTVIQERTLLGRVRITAARRDGKREIIINPRTGEILRDLWTPAAGGAQGVKILDDKSDTGRRDADDDDDHGGNDDDDDDDDNSGSGGDDDD